MSGAHGHNFLYSVNESSSMNYYKVTERSTIDSSIKSIVMCTAKVTKIIHKQATKIVTRR